MDFTYRVKKKNEKTERDGGVQHTEEKRKGGFDHRVTRSGLGFLQNLTGSFKNTGVTKANHKMKKCTESRDLRTAHCLGEIRML